MRWYNAAAAVLVFRSKGEGIRKVQRPPGFESCEVVPPVRKPPR